MNTHTDADGTHTPEDCIVWRPVDFIVDDRAHFRISTRSEEEAQLIKKMRALMKGQR